MVQRKQRPPPTGGRGLKKIHYQKNFGEDLFAEQQIIMKSVCFIFIHDLFELIGIVCFQISHLIG